MNRIILPSAPRAAIKPHGLFQDTFDIVVVLKGLNGFAELVVGTTFLIIQPGTVMEWVQWLTQSELLQDPHDFARHLSAALGKQFRA